MKRFHHLQSWVGLILLVLQGLIPATAAWGQGLWERTSLLDLRAGSVRSDRARDLSAGRYALEDGTMVDLFDWYRPRVTNMNILFLTELEPSLALIWGISTGETGQKYRIDPGLWLGVFYRAELAENQVLTFAARTLLGGAMQERPCVAFYTILADIPQVACRLR